MKTYQIFVVPMGDAKITEELEFYPRATVLRYKARNDLYDKGAPKYSVAQSDKIVKSKEYFVAPSA